jgi:tetratricopeptide (TPR) repeat protein
MHTGPALRHHLKISLWIAVVVLAGLSCRKPGYKVIVGKEGYTHIISKGETLESIAEKYYGDKSLGKALGEYNGVDPLSPLETGVTLIVPFDRAEIERIRTAQTADVLYNKGTVLARTGQYEEAARYLESAVQADGTHVDAWYNLALVYGKLERSEKAIPILGRLTQSFPSEKTYHYSLGAALRLTDKHREALTEFKKALEADPSYREAQYAVALTLEDLGKRKQAMDEWVRYLEIDSDSIWSDEARMHLDNLQRR